MLKKLEVEKTYLNTTKVIDAKPRVSIIPNC